MACDTEEMWNAFGAPLRLFIRRRIPDRSQAEDILQDVFVKVHTRIDRLRDADRLQSWIYQIARNAIVDHYRKGRGESELPIDVPEPETDRSAKAKKENLHCLRPMIGSLPLGYRDVMMLSEIEGLPHREVATRLGLSLPAVKSKVLRGRALLKKLIVGACHFDFDIRGRPIDYDREKSACHCWEAEED